MEYSLIQVYSNVITNCIISTILLVVALIIWACKIKSNLNTKEADNFYYYLCISIIFIIITILLIFAFKFEINPYYYM